MTAQTGMRPTLAMSDIYGPGLAYSGFAPGTAARWISDDTHALFGMTGNMVCVMGTMPIVSAAGAVAGLDLLREFGHEPSENLYTFRDEDEYWQVLQQVTDAGLRIVTQHRHPGDRLHDGRTWIPADLQSTLNDKGNLGDLVPAANRIDRIVGDPRDPAWCRAVRAAEFPLALKVATRMSTGSGRFDVVRVATPADLDAACALISEGERAVAEKWLVEVRHLGVNVAVMPDGHVVYIGCAQIVSDPNGIYRGNWLGDVEATPATVELAQVIARAGAGLGYRGMMCVDVAELADGRSLAYDLNFRLCGSTFPLLMLPAARQATGGVVARTRSWLMHMDLAEATPRIRRAAGLGVLPMSILDPQVQGLDGPVRVYGLLLGESREDVEQRDDELASLGMT